MRREGGDAANGRLQVVAVDVIVQLGGVQLRIGLGRLHRVVHLLAHRQVDCLQLVGGDQAGVDDFLL